MSEDLVTWLRAHLDEDERVANAAGGCDWSNIIADRDENIHIARHDPARVLAEVEAKRRILEAVERYFDPHPGQPCTNLDEDGEQTWEPCELHVERMATAITPYVLPLLALPYADRPGYREEWQPIP